MNRWPTWAGVVIASASTFASASLSHRRSGLGWSELTDLWLQQLIEQLNLLRQPLTLYLLLDVFLRFRERGLGVFKDLLKRRTPKSKVSLSFERTVRS